MPYPDRNAREKGSSALKNALQKFTDEIAEINDAETLVELYYIIRGAHDEEALKALYEHRVNENEISWNLHLSFVQLPSLVCSYFEALVKARLKVVCHYDKGIRKKAIDAYKK